jgi:hypothetical protein
VEHKHDNIDDHGTGKFEKITRQDLGIAKLTELGGSWGLENWPETCLSSNSAVAIRKSSLPTDCQLRAVRAMSDQ